MPHQILSQIRSKQSKDYSICGEHSIYVLKIWVSHFSIHVSQPYTTKGRIFIQVLPPPTVPLLSAHACIHFMHTSYAYILCITFRLSGTRYLTKIDWIIIHISPSIVARVMKLVRGCTCRPSGATLKVEVMGQRSRSPGKKKCDFRALCIVFK